MDSRTRARQANRTAAAARWTDAKIEKELLDLGPAWATIVYVTEKGYGLEALHENRGEAEAVARLETLQYLDAASYTPGVPYTVVFAAPVLLDKGYARDKVYYANLRAATGGHAHLRSVALWETRALAEAEVAASADLPAKDVYTFIGGPVSLAKRPAPPAVKPPAPKTKAERRAEKKAAKRAEKEAAKRRHVAGQADKKEGE